MCRLMLIFPALTGSGWNWYCLLATNTIRTIKKGLIQTYTSGQRECYTFAGCTKAWSQDTCCHNDEQFTSQQDTGLNPIG